MSFFVRIGRDEKSRIADYLLPILSSHYGVPVPIWKFDSDGPYYNKKIIGLTPERDLKKISFVKEEILHEYFHYLVDMLSEDRIDKACVAEQDSIIIGNMTYSPLLDAIEAGADTFSGWWLEILSRKELI